MPSASAHEAPALPEFHDSRTVDAARDLSPVLGLVAAVAASALLWMVPLAVWWLLR